MRLALLSALLCLAACTPAPPPAEPFDERAGADARRIEADVRFLADDLLEGREAGTRGFDLAALYVAQRMRAYGDDADSIREFASDFVAKLCDRLLAGGAPGLHFYTLNLAKPTLNVLAKLA